MTTIFIILLFFSASLKDREKIEVYNLVISAINGASSPKLSGNTTVRIDVLDTNDEAPLFTKASYNETISEGDKAGTPVVIVSANDKDLVSLPLTFAVLFCCTGCGDVYMLLSQSKPLLSFRELTVGCCIGFSTTT